ncbi:hypothetical protein GCM10022631_26520 [Deinococcus rubellus]
MPDSRMAPISKAAMTAQNTEEQSRLMDWVIREEAISSGYPNRTHARAPGKLSRPGQLLMPWVQLRRLFARARRCSR